MQLFYDTDMTTTLTGGAQFNGNINGSLWRISGNSKKGYNFSYDGLNRLTAADYGTYSGSWATTTAYDLGSVAYDSNGNISSLNRKNSSGSNRENLSYTYSGNQLSSITGTYNGNSASGSFSYDGNGNAINDGLRGLTSIGYFDELNLPRQYYKDASNKVDYSYDATGIKWGKTATISGTAATTLYYGPFIYVGGTLSKVLTTEGYYDPATSLYHYYLKDHLGNTRITFHYSGTTAVVDQEVEYYPFGSLFADNNLDKNTYLYNGKELNNEFFENYDYGARFYDPTLARFHSIDNYSEKYYSQSTYQYALNNPISNIDIMGDSAWTINNTWNKDFISKYQSSVQNRIQQYQKDGKEFTCEDLALSVMMDFAEENGLPVSITNESGTYDARSDDYTDAESFKNDVLTTTAAPDLQNNKNTSTIDASQATSGDIILNRNSEGRAHHTQVVNSPVNSIGVMGIKQGNSGAMNIVPGASRVFGAGNPKSAFYTGKPIESAIYVPAANYYKNYSTGATLSNYSTQKNIVFKRFNFNKF